MATDPANGQLTCSNEDCGELINPKRAALGYKTCLKCGSPDPIRTVAVAYNKGPYMLVGREDLNSVEKKV